MGPIVRIIGLETAVPRHRLSQREISEAARKIFGEKRRDIDRFSQMYGNAGVDTRYSCVPLEWHFEEMGWKARNLRYADEALALLEVAASRCLAQARLDADRVDGIIVVSTSGILTPSLDALLLNRLGFRSDLERLPVFGLGCAGGTLGLARAAAMARATPGKIYLLLVVELCSLTFRNHDYSNGNIVATALFGDGAAALLLQAGDSARAPEAYQPHVIAWGEHTWPNSEEVMGWRIEEDGFGVLFSKEIPSLVQERMRPVCQEFLSRQALALSDLSGHICHPGGAKVLAALARALNLDARSLDWSQSVLKDYGNMSAASVLFVLQRALERADPGKYLVSALGPGFSVGFVLLDLPGKAKHAGIP